MNPRPIDPESRRIGHALRALREERELRQVDIAAELGVTGGGYAAVECGRARMFVADIPRYAAALGVPTAYLARRLALCDHASADIANTLVTRFGPQIGGALVRIDRILARMEHDDASAITVMMANTASKYELRHG